ncbi:bifunctional riboflavin kinase/FAD synthetase [Scytonema sp. NUACC26]|uniref:bifunctional riboflavin kinase/FAD synthetase n=1 Tax=Scytonema sp. NUACC26 TaxID=3140176 RepID=UPI0034DC0D98
MEKIANYTNNVRVAYSTSEALTPTAVALGKFDGLHRGHQRVIQPVLNQVRCGECSTGVSRPSALHGLANKRSQLLEEIPFTFAKEYVYPTVVAFHPHPQEFFTGRTHALLTPLDEKVQLLRSLGVEQLVLLPFNKELTALTPEEFVRKILVQQLQCRHISVGQDFCFGRKRSGTAKDLQFLAAQYDIPVTIVPLHTTCAGDFSTDTTEEPISSSLIRHHLERGDIQQSNQLLGRPYTLIGEVVKSQRFSGKTTDFCSVNLQLPKEKFLPRPGVYAVRVFDIDETLDAIPLTYPGVMNISNGSTMNSAYPCVEVHLLNWFGDLYGKKLVVKLEKFLRSE